MIKIIELESEIYFAGISHMDLSPRNIILCPPPTSVNSSPKLDRSTSSLNLQSSADSRVTNEGLVDSNLRVCFIDFGSSIVHCQIPEWNYSRPRISPITRWWGVKMTDFRDTEWLPPHREASTWLWKTWKDHKDYVPAVMDPKSKVGRPVEYWDGKYSNDHVDLDMESDVEDEIYSEDEIDSDGEMDVKDEVDVKGGADVKDGVDVEGKA
jgi:serine/threonine protein kinase